MTDRPVSFKAGDAWPMVEPGVPPGEGARADNVWQFIAFALDTANTVLTRAGFAEADLHELGVSDLRERVDQGSLEDVAIGVWATGRALASRINLARPDPQMQLINARQMEREKARIEASDPLEEPWQGRERGGEYEREWLSKQAAVGHGLVDAMAYGAIEFGMNFAVMQSMLIGLTDAAKRGRKDLEDRRFGADETNKNKAADRELRMKTAVRLAEKELEFPLPNGRKKWTAQFLAEQVLGVWPDADERLGIATIAEYIRHAIAEDKLTLPK